MAVRTTSGALRAAKAAPLVLHVGLAAWASLLALSSPVGDAIFALLVVVGASLGLGLSGAHRPAAWKDALSTLLMGVAFVAAGVYVANVGIVPLYFFVAVLLLTYHLAGFRTNVASLQPTFAEDPRSSQGLSSAFVATAIRGVLVAALVLMISLMAFVAATALVVGFADELTAFLLALGVLMALLALATLPRSAIRLK